jgi:predicted benzoate:H+ symporter BenE
MSYRVRPDLVNGKRLRTAALLFAVAMLCVGGSGAWVIVSNKGQGGDASGPQTLSVCCSLLLLFIAVLFVFFAHARMTWRYRCPQCGARIKPNIPNEVGAAIRHRCVKCRTDWDTGWHVSAGGD